MEAVVISNELLDLIGVDGIVGQNFLNRYRQRWQFGARGPLGFPEVGNLELIPLEGQ
ncbi:MAG: hypothetical protein HC925_08780 [Coleofasciculaceae cyanobacterium SM2_3_26]|nr:hypothetical protein [Coleofasciculaceae cyanobacterium SM2_3_26]